MIFVLRFFCYKICRFRLISVFLIKSAIFFFNKYHIRQERFDIYCNKFQFNYNQISKHLKIIQIYLILLIFSLDYIHI